MARPREFDTELAIQQLEELFWSDGFKATSISDLESKTGLARPRLYAAFGSKQDMLNVSIDHYLQSHIEPIAEGIEAGGIAGIAGWFRMAESLCSEQPAKARRGCLVVNSLVEFGGKRRDHQGIRIEVSRAVAGRHSNRPRKGSGIGKSHPRYRCENSASHDLAAGDIRPNPWRVRIGDDSQINGRGDRPGGVVGCLIGFVRLGGVPLGNVRLGRRTVFGFRLGRVGGLRIARAGPAKKRPHWVHGLDRVVSPNTVAQRAFKNPSPFGPPPPPTSRTRRGRSPCRPAACPPIIPPRPNRSEPAPQFTPTPAARVRQSRATITCGHHARPSRANGTFV